MISFIYYFEFIHHTADAVSNPFSYFCCLDNQQCVGKEVVCDGVAHCSDGSDEDPILCGE